MFHTSIWNIYFNIKSYNFHVLQTIKKNCKWWLLNIHIYFVLGLYFSADIDWNTYERIDCFEIRQTANHVDLNGTLRFLDARNWNVHGSRYMFFIFLFVDTDDIAKLLVLLLRLWRHSYSMDVD